MSVCVEDGVCLMFPGLSPGSQVHVERFLTGYEPARRLVSIADEVMGESLLSRCRRDSDLCLADLETKDGLVDWGPHRVAYLLSMLALAEGYLNGQGADAPSLVSGISIGGCAAAVQAKSIELDDMIDMVLRTSNVERQFFRESIGRFGCLSIGRLCEQEVVDLFDDVLERTGGWLSLSASQEGVVVVVSGEIAAVEALNRRVCEIGGIGFFHVTNMAVHCEEMKELARRMVECVYPKYRFVAPSLPMMSDAGVQLESGEQVRRDFEESWVKCFRARVLYDAMYEHGVRRFTLPSVMGAYSRVFDDRFIVRVVRPRDFLKLSGCADRCG